MASHRHFPKMGGIHFPYWLPGRDPVQLEIIRFKAGFFLLFCCDESDAFLSNYIISVGVLSMMGYQVEAAFSAVCRTTSTIRSPRGFPPAAKCSEIFIRLFPHTKYCVPFSACMTCPVRGVKASLSLFAIQCPPYSVFKVQCRTGAAKTSAYIYHLSFTVCRC